MERSLRSGRSKAFWGVTDLKLRLYRPKYIIYYMDKETVISFIRKEKQSKGIVPSVRQILVAFNINRQIFYDLFSGGINEARYAAGVPLYEGTGKMEKVIEGRRTKLENRSFSKEQYDANVKEYCKLLEMKEYDARIDSSKIYSYVKEVVPKVDHDLWRRFRIISCGHIREALNEAVSYSGEYFEIVKKKIAQEISFKDNAADFRKYVLENLQHYL